MQTKSALMDLIARKGLKVFKKLLKATSKVRGLKQPQKKP